MDKTVLSARDLLEDSFRLGIEILETVAIHVVPHQIAQVHRKKRVFFLLTVIPGAHRAQELPEFSSAFGGGD